MSFNLLKVIKKILSTSTIDRVPEIEDSVDLSKNSNDNSEKVQARQPENSETAISEPDSSPKLSSQTLLSVFRKAECCTLDGLNEYDDDFTSFTPLGDLVTHEMQQAADRLAKQALQSVNRENSETINSDVVTAQSSFDE
ncbi:MAG: hypothetical protein V3V18_04815 [Methylococcales bacterium]